MFTKDTAKNAIRKRWRKANGIRLVCSIRPYKGGSRTVCEVEGNQYVGVGKNNTESLINCFKVIDIK